MSGAARSRASRAGRRTRRYLAGGRLPLVCAAVLSVPACGVDTEPVDPRCVLPSEPTLVREADGAVLLQWSFVDDPIYETPVLTTDANFIAYRAAIRADSADLRRPISDEPEPRDEAEREIWRMTRANNEMVFAGEVGTVEPVRCLESLLFAFQHNRVSQLDQPTEFLASVLRRDGEEGPELTVVFGAGMEMFPPKSVYGFDVVDELRADGWTYAYALHNHTIQTNGERLALGTPAPSTSDIHLSLNLARGSGLQEVRVTNGFYTFRAPAGDLVAFEVPE